MKKRLKIAIIVVLSLVIFLGATFVIYASDYYRADDIANAIMESDDIIIVQNSHITLSSTIPGDTGIIFYPGAKVEYFAYLPILEKINSTTGSTCFLVKMPFNMAIFNSDAANSIIDQHPEIENWYMAGHSMGCAMASSYASKNQDKVKGLILLGAYI